MMRGTRQNLSLFWQGDHTTRQQLHCLHDQPVTPREIWNWSRVSALLQGHQKPQAILKLQPGELYHQPQFWQACKMRNLNFRPIFRSYFTFRIPCKVLKICILTSSMYLAINSTQLCSNLGMLNNLAVHIRSTALSISINLAKKTPHCLFKSGRKNISATSMTSYTFSNDSCKKNETGCLKFYSKLVILDDSKKHSK